MKNLPKMVKLKLELGSDTNCKSPREGWIGDDYKFMTNNAELKQLLAINDKQLQHNRYL